MSTPAEISTSDDAPTPSDLTRFQLEQLRIIERDGPLYGLAIKRALEDLLNTEVHHGRLYPNLDQLVASGLVTKRERDKRTNEYALTASGQELLDDRRVWLGCDGTEGDG